MRFPVPGTKLLSTNDANRQHWASKRRQLAPYRDEMGWAWKRLPKATRDAITDVPCRVQVALGFPGPVRRRDPSNYVGTVIKALVDTLVQLGVWPDDNPDWVSVDEPTCVQGTEIVVRLVPR
jgi:Holliday junction resolvase RusA-like endonuclease